jgi:hypothetical protein
MNWGLMGTWGLFRSGENYVWNGKSVFCSFDGRRENGCPEVLRVSGGRISGDRTGILALLSG